MTLLKPLRISFCMSGRQREAGTSMQMTDTYLCMSAKQCVLQLSAHEVVVKPLRVIIKAKYAKSRSGYLGMKRLIRAHNIYGTFMCNQHSKHSHLRAASQLVEVNKMLTTINEMLAKIGTNTAAPPSVHLYEYTVR